MKLVSIITPMYNSKYFFEETFNSVLNQTYQNWEWIIIDDNSSDGSYEYAKKLIKDNERIKLIKNKTNYGSAYSRNKGLELAKGTYITFLDSDDFLDSTYLAEQINFIANNEPIITSGYRRMGKKTNSPYMPRKSITYKQLLYGCDTSCLTTMYNREIVGNITFDETIKKDEDYVFWLNILKLGYTVKTNERVLATYRIRKESKNGNKAKLLKPIYNVYHNVLKFNFIKTCWHIFWYFIYGIKKYRGVR